MRISLVLIGTIFSISAFATNSPKIAIANILPVEDNTAHAYTQDVTVVFKTSVAGTIDLSDPTKWTVVVFRNSVPTILHGGGQKEWTVTRITASGTASVSTESTTKPVLTVLGPQAEMLTLPEGSLTKDVTSLVVSFDTAQSLWAPPASLPTASTGLFSSAQDKSHSDVYLSGLYSPAIHSAAQYSIDAQARLVKQIGLSHFRLGGLATVSTDKRPTADPDSFLVSGVLQWIARDQRFLAERAQGVLLDWNFAGLEFDRKTTTETFVSTPVVEIPLRLYPAPRASSSVSLGMIPYFGLSFGQNLSNALNSGGSGTVFRGVLGSSVSFNVKTKWGFLQQIGVTSTYTARIPAKNEVFTNTSYNSGTGKSTDVPILSSQVRHHVTDELDLVIAKPFSITIKHEYGELPPVFRKVDNKVSIGFTVMLQQNNSALAKVDPEK